MAAIAFTEHGITNAKQALRNCFTTEKSSHLTEALAAACGFRTHAAFRQELQRSNVDDPDFIWVDERKFIERLHELNGRPISKDEDFHWFDSLAYPSWETVIKTKSPRWYECDYQSPREKAWRNLMVAGINAGIVQKLFTVRPGDNRWPGAKGADPHFRDPAHVYRFSVEDIPAIASVSDAGWDELSIHVAFWPSNKAETWIRVTDSGFLAGEACAWGWLERQDGAWVQTAPVPSLACRRNRLQLVAGLTIRPRGFEDRGDFKN